MTGFEVGDTCNRDGCNGLISEHEVDNCSCHINPPCPACTTPREFCPVCDWQAKDDTVMSEGPITLSLDGFSHVHRKPRVLDRSKIDYVTTMHSSSSQKVTGVFPVGTPRSDIVSRVKGTFGGRFEKLDNATGDFVYIAYTD